MLATQLHAALVEAGVPLVGVSIGRPDDRATWVVQFAPQATPQQRAAADAVIAAFDASPSAVAARALEARVYGDPQARAVVLFSLRERLGREPTPLEVSAARGRLVQAFRDGGV